MAEPFEGFVVGGRYRLHEQMWPASPGFGSYIGGIQPKGRFPATEAIVLLAEVGGGRYGNWWDGEHLVYQGEDDKWADDPTRADQMLDKGNNRVLHHQSESGVPLYLFTKIHGDELWSFEGLAQVEDSRVLHRHARNVVEFRILPLGLASTAQMVQAETELLAAEIAPPTLSNRESRLSENVRKARSAKFPERVKRAYGNRCAVCGSLRLNAWGRPEVQAAHIFPKEQNGADDVRNGLALCSFHHWAFDGGLFLIDENLRIHVTRPGLRIPDLKPLEGEKLEVLPPEMGQNPHPIYIEARLNLPKFAKLRR